jgi:2-polyprenyl-3-methyl-5-hydroxy-6-metoxy-1,4-benzoquinol methylase
MEWRLFDPDQPPPWADPGWYTTREQARHLEDPWHGPRLQRTAEIVRLAWAAYEATSLVDLGAGDGGLLSLLRLPEGAAWGYDLQPSNLAGAIDRGVNVRLADVTRDRINWGKLAVATEILEHLVDPHGMVRRIAAHCQILVASSPMFENDADHYEHHLWAWDPAGYKDLVVAAGWEIMHHERVGGAQILLAVRL